jgi:hypothetical protein
VEHQIRVRHVVVATDEATGLEVVGGSRAPAQEQPLRADPRVAPLRQVRLHGHGLRAGVLDVHLEVVLQVLAHSRQVLDRIDTQGAQAAGVADAGQL